MLGNVINEKVGIKFVNDGQKEFMAKVFCNTLPKCLSVLVHECYSLEYVIYCHID